MERDAIVIYAQNEPMPGVVHPVPHRRMNANGRIVLLGRSGERLALNTADHLITNAVSITGSRGHLWGAFHSLLALYRILPTTAGFQVMGFEPGEKSP